MVRAVRRPSGVVNGGVRPSLHTALLTRFRVKGARVRFRACVQEHPRPKTSGTGRSATTRGKGTEKTADGQTFRRYRRVWAHFFGLKCIFAGKIHFWAKKEGGGRRCVLLLPGSPHFWLLTYAVMLRMGFEGFSASSHLMRSLSQSIPSFVRRRILTASSGSNTCLSGYVSLNR